MSVVIENEELFDALSSVKEKLRLDLDTENFDNQVLFCQCFIKQKWIVLESLRIERKVSLCD